jgi:hypothetical protein
MTEPTVVDRFVMALSGALMLLGIVVLGLVETLAGRPYGAAPLTNDAGEVVATPLVDPTIRTGLVLAGLLVLLVYGVYRLVTPHAGEERQETAAASN